MRGPIRFLTLCLISVSIWAAELNVPGLPYLFQVNDHIYRGAQPADPGWANLARLGVKIVVDLRGDGDEGAHSTAAERTAVEAAGMHYVSVPMSGIAAPSDAQVSRVLTLLNSSERVFVHCSHGKDRTGTVIACYRIAHDGWTNEKAMTEAKSLGLHWIEIGMKRYISNYRALPATLMTTKAGN